MRLQDVIQKGYDLILAHYELYSVQSRVSLTRVFELLLSFKMSIAGVAMVVLNMSARSIIPSWIHTKYQCRFVTTTECYLLNGTKSRSSSTVSKNLIRSGRQSTIMAITMNDLGGQQKCQ